MVEGEIKSFIMVWSTVLGCLCYCHAIDKLLLPKPTIIRALSLIPVACLFMVLPLNLHSINLGATSSFFVAWLASFKVLLFAFGDGPLASSPPLPLSSFVLVACLPIKFQSLQESSSSQPKKAQRSSVNHLTKLMLLLILFRVYKYQKCIHRNLLLFCYCLHIYFCLELMLVAVAAAVRAGTGMEMVPPFDEPHLATSLQDFWGRRWNLIVSNILRPTVYEPVKSTAGCVFPGKWAVVTAVMATFLVSGVMHELVFYNIGRVRPSGEVLGFFVLHGACLGVEIGVKKWLKGRFWVPSFVSGPLTLCFVILTSFWLFFPPFLKNKADLKVCTEFLAFVESQLIFACTLILLMLWKMPSLSSACDTDSGGCRDCIVKHTMKDCPKCSTIMCCMAQCLWGGSSRSKCSKKCDCNGGYPRLSDCKNCLSPCKCSCSV